jgi:DNA-binding MarR family transcriptional regulator
MEENMHKDPLNEREFELVNIIGATLGGSQRDISRQLNLSLGMTNMLLKRLVTKGYIRVRQLNQRKVQYLLTPKGFTEKMRKSIKYTLKTINSITLLKERVQLILKEAYLGGESVFYLLGESGLTPLVEMVFKEALPKACVLIKIQHLNAQPISGMLLIGQEKIEEDYKDVKHINLIEELAKTEDFLMAGINQAGL